MKILVVDPDEDFRRDLIEKLKVVSSECNVIGQSDCIEDAEKLILSILPDFVFLSCELPDGKCFDLLHGLSSKNIHIQVAVISDKEDFAYEAFRFRVLHYLLKPVDVCDLQEAICRYYYHGEKAGKAALLTNGSNGHKETRICFSLINGLKLVDVSKIIFLEADHCYTKVIMDNRDSLFLSRSLCYYQEQLKNYQFLRVHRKYFVNTEKVIGYNLNDGLIELTENHSIHVSRRKRREVLEKLKSKTFPTRG